MAKHKNSVYGRISEDIAAKIKSGEYAVGSLLEPERRLMEKYGVERTTVRRALELLVSDGLIVKKSGLGTFVSDGKSIPADKTAVVTKPVKKQIRTTLPDKIKLVPDELSAAFEVFTYLENNGHEKVMCIADNASKYAVICGEAVKRGMYDSNLFLLTGKNKADDVFVSAWRSLRLPKPTAVIAENEASAKLILTTVKRMRISVPDELSVIVLCKDGSSEIAGCVCDNTNRKNLIKMLESVADADLCEITVLNKMIFEEGSTAEKVKKDKLGSSTMSSFLL